MTSGVPAGYVISATATDPAGNTSEFGPSVVVGQGSGAIPPITGVSLQPQTASVASRPELRLIARAPVASEIAPVDEPSSTSAMTYDRVFVESLATSWWLDPAEFELLPTNTSA
jgi:hypothetical protein